MQKSGDNPENLQLLALATLAKYMEVVGSMSISFCKVGVLTTLHFHWSTAAQELVMVRELEDVEVTAPDVASFRCEVSVAIDKPPVWTLNGESLQSGPLVRVESQGTVHKLTLKQTSEEMSGMVRFTTGKARSSATLRVNPE